MWFVGYIEGSQIEFVSLCCKRWVIWTFSMKDALYDCHIANTLENTID